MKLLRLLFGLLIITSMLLLNCCALEPKEMGLKYQGTLTQTSQAIVIVPQPSVYQKVYLKIINYSNISEMSGLRLALAGQLQNEGYQIVNDGSQASYILQADILYAGPSTIESANSILLQGYQGSIKPAGEIAIGNKPYTVVVSQSTPTYLVVVDLIIWQKATLAFNLPGSMQPIHNNSWERYETRMISTYSQFIMPAQFSAIQTNFTSSIARAIAAMF
ncbi:MAG: hypothetical protein A3E87_00740 [Gammaproteobacteria bacterium RIFCSPHIGHO2_12_FULL_35_23]|nr:MAG: hypothetical protein A3E87_00740 [Gammaproteobacteria bacterium RIFCSPHIGHO2_12_FULL_35_23]